MPATRESVTQYIVNLMAEGYSIQEQRDALADRAVAVANELKAARNMLKQLEAEADKLAQLKKTMDQAKVADQQKAAADAIQQARSKPGFNAAKPDDTKPEPEAEPT